MRPLCPQPEKPKSIEEQKKQKRPSLHVHPTGFDSDWGLRAPSYVSRREAPRTRDETCAGPLRIVSRLGRAEVERCIAFLSLDPAVSRVPTGSGDPGSVLPEGCGCRSAVIPSKRPVIGSSGPFALWGRGGFQVPLRGLGITVHDPGIQVLKAVGRRQTLCLAARQSEANRGWLVADIIL